MNYLWCNTVFFVQFQLAYFTISQPKFHSGQRFLPVLFCSFEQGGLSQRPTLYVLFYKDKNGQFTTHVSITEPDNNITMPMVVIAKLCIYFQFYTMSVVTNQPLPFGQLEREKHIQMVFTAFHKSCVASCECRRANSLGPEHQQKPPRCESDEQLVGLAPERRVENVCTVSQPGVEVQGSRFMSALETVSQMHVTARPELQGECERQRLCICVQTFAVQRRPMLHHCRSTVCS